MRLLDVLDIVGLALLLAFIVFAFRQGLKVKPDKDARDSGSGLYGGGSDGGSHGGGGGAH